MTEPQRSEWEARMDRLAAEREREESKQLEAGFVGLLTANSFMKREFGKALIEEFLPTVDLTHMIDTSGVYIPGHGTPTCILLGRNRSPDEGNRTIRKILGIKGEPTVPDDPGKGLVWTAILDGMYGPDRKADVFDDIPTWSKRMHAGDRLGELYQAQCEDARKGRALVQTPPFCRTLLLRETLGRSIQTFGARNTRFLDPSCGTGHLLVDAFRVLYRSIRAEYLAMGGERRTDYLASEALACVTGCDLDPVCVEISKYRLIQAVYDETGWDGLTVHTNLYVGDSLLHHRPRLGDRLDDEMAEVMQAGRFTAVAANPPYIVSPSKDVAQKYRDRYVSAKAKFSLGCPFTELCFAVAKRQDQKALPDVGDSVPIYPTAEQIAAIEKQLPPLPKPPQAKAPAKPVRARQRSLF